MYPPKKIKRQLSELLEKFKNESGTGRLVMIVEIRNYVTHQDPYVLKDEIDTISDTYDLNILQGVGIKGFLWYEIQKQKARCIGL